MLLMINLQKNEIPTYTIRYKPKKEVGRQSFSSYQMYKKLSDLCSYRTLQGNAVLSKLPYL